MIVSHKHRFIFIKTHKTAGTSLQIALSRHCGEDDIITRLHQDDSSEIVKNQGKDQQNVNVPKGRYNARDWFQYLVRGREQVFTEHNAISYLKRWLPKETWDSYYKFGFERHPYDKVISYYYWRTRNENVTFDEFLNGSISSLSDWNMYAINGQIGVDKMYKFEELNASVEHLKSKLGFDLDMKSINAKSSHRNNDTISLSDRQKAIIDRAFTNEFSHFYAENL